MAHLCIYQSTPNGANIYCVQRALWPEHDRKMRDRLEAEPGGRGSTFNPGHPSFLKRSGALLLKMGRSNAHNNLSFWIRKVGFLWFDTQALYLTTLEIILHFVFTGYKHTKPICHPEGVSLARESKSAEL